MPPTTAEFLNALAPTWQAAVAAALLQGTLALAVVVLLWLALRKNLGNALAHGLFFLVPVKTVAAALFVAWPVVISFSITVPETVYSAIYPPQPAPAGAIPELNPPAVAIEAAMPPPQEQWQALPPDFANPGPEAAFSEPFTTDHKTVVVTEAEKPSLGTAAWAMIAWAAACFVLIAFVCIRHMRLMRRMVRDAVPPGADYQDKLNRLAAEMRLPRVPQLVESPAIATPAVVGLVRPRLVVPPGFFSTFDADQQRWILLHELAHIRRRDLWWLAFERLTGIAFFFHPALWISSRATRHFRELACDDLAQMQSGLSPRQCAETFLKLIMWTSRNPARPHPITPTLSLTDRYPAIQRRIMNMTDLNPQSRWTRTSKAMFAMLMATAILISLPFSPKLVARAATPVETTPTAETTTAPNEEPPQIELDDHSVVLRLIDETTSVSIEGAKVKAKVDDWERTMTTNQQGFIRVPFQRTENDLIQFSVFKDGYVPKIQSWLRDETEEFPPSRQVTWKMLKAMKIGGQVVDTAGSPIPNAIVKVLYTTREFPLSAYPDMSLDPVKTDALGRWEITQVPAEARQISVTVRHKSYISDNQVPFFPPFTPLKSLNFRSVMSKGGSLKGRLLANGKPVEGAKVFQQGMVEHIDELTVLSDSNGEFQVESIRPGLGTLALAFLKPGLATQVASVSKEEMNQVKTWEMQPGRNIQGTIRFPDGKPVANARISGSELGRHQILLNQDVFSDESGQFQLNDLKSGTVELFVRNQDSFTKIIKIDTTEVKPVDITMTKMPVVVGIVKDKATGQPIRGFHIKATYNGREVELPIHDLHGTQPKRLGRFRHLLMSPAPETYKLRFESVGYKPFETKAYKVTEPFTQTEILLEPDAQKPLKSQELTVRILQADGKPADGATIAIKTVTKMPFMQNGRIVGIRDYELFSLDGSKPLIADNQGRFTLEYKDAAPIQSIWVTHKTGAFRIDRPKLGQGEQEWKLKPYLRIEGQYLVDGNPQPLGVVRLNYPEIRQGWEFNQVANPDDTGRFTIENVFPEEFNLQYPGFAAVRHPGNKYYDLKQGDTLRVQANLINGKLIEKRLAENEEFAKPIVTSKSTPDTLKQDQKLDEGVSVVNKSNQPPQTDNAATQKVIAKAEKKPDQAAPKLPASALATMKIGGFVVDSTDKPIEGVTARVYVGYPKGDGTRQSEQMKLESRPTDAQGRWSIDGVPANTTGMHILLKHPTMIYGAKFDLPILKPFTSLQDGSIKMRMEPGCRLTLRVRDHANKAVEGAAVYNDRAFWLENDPDPKPIGHTDAKGEFAIANEIPGTHKYIVTKPGHAPGLVTAEVDQNTPLQQVQLGMSRPISATLLDWNRKPMAGAEVMLGAFRDWGQVPGYRVKTDAKGHFEMKDLPWEPLVIEIRHERMQFTKSLNQREMKLGTVQFGPVNELKFQVTDSASTKPLDKIATYLFQSEDNSTSTFSTLGWERNPQGEFKQVFYPAEDKKYTLLVLAEGYKPYISEPIAFDDAHRLINLKVAMKRHEKMITYRGKAVLTNGQPSAGRIVRFTPINAGVTVGKNLFTWQVPDVKEILTDANGGFEFQSPGQIQELLIIDDETFYHSNQMSQWNGESRAFTLKPKPIITGTVTDQGKPVNGAYISLSQARLDQYIPLWNGLQGTTFTDSQGHYKLPCIYPGPVQVGVSIKTSRSSDRVYGIGRELKPGSEDVFNFELSDFIRN